MVQISAATRGITFFPVVVAGVTVGLPEEIAHIVLAHSFEGDFLVRSLEATIVHRADSLWWAVAGGAGLLDSRSNDVLENRKIAPRPLREKI